MENDTVCPQSGDTVLVHLPEDWRPGNGIRVYPAIVLYPTNELTFHLDVLVLNGMDAPYPMRWVPQGFEPGTWQMKP